MTLQTSFFEKSFSYRGPELRPHFLLETFGLQGSALAAWVGPCLVETDSMVDWEDRLNADRIESKQMLHFLGEFFGPSLKESVYLQRLWIAMIREELEDRAISNDGGFERCGDDLYWQSNKGQKRKLNVSIVTASPVSTLLHLGVNVDPEGAPVPAIGLRELGVDPEPWAKEMLRLFALEWQGVEKACAKVRPVI